MEHGFTVEAWHGTEAGFDTPDPHRNRGNGDYGFHFALGSAAAANERIGYAATWVGKLTVFLTQDHRPRNPAYRILPLVVNAHHPFEMPDLGNWAAPSIWRKWAGSSEFKGPNELRDYILAPIPEGQAPLAWHRGLEAVLEKLGYDSIQYKNIVEAAGSRISSTWSRRKFSS